ncbi:uncharacterized protein N7473_008924 [Penicillium subrubescens]|uniref:uncharacterized protein n=1 Tax=Penicillium subrubescens TaxID=1316194 RepID=UPI002544F506|nr:uncharacterized protein N7473_008924 [Penicillium subrubescens]KAJ5886250.1 hypothetical protein N7473_008924 [Penicillium subrubescens]
MTRIKFHESRVQALVQNPLQVHLIREQIKANAKAVFLDHPFEVVTGIEKNNKGKYAPLITSISLQSWYLSHYGDFKRFDMHISFV